MPLPPTVDLAQRDTIRLVPTRRLAAPGLKPLAADRATLDALTGLAGVTDARLRADEAGLADLDPRELVFGRAGALLINAAFVYTRPGGNRFNNEYRGAWYCGFEAETALAEVSYHLTHELEAVGRFENTTDYGALAADFFGRFHDLRGSDTATEPALSIDPAVAYLAGQRLAKRLRSEATGNGIVYPSARRAGGTCLAAFRPDLVHNLREGGIWRLVWQGTPQPAITRRDGVPGTSKSESAAPGPVLPHVS